MGFGELNWSFLSFQQRFDTGITNHEKTGQEFMPALNEALIFY